MYQVGQTTLGQMIKIITNQLNQINEKKPLSMFSPKFSLWWEEDNKIDILQQYLKDRNEIFYNSQIEVSDSFLLPPTHPGIPGYTIYGVLIINEKANYYKIFLSDQLYYREHFNATNNIVNIQRINYNQYFQKKLIGKDRIISYKKIKEIEKSFERNIYVDVEGEKIYEIMSLSSEILNLNRILKTDRPVEDFYNRLNVFSFYKTHDTEELKIFQTKLKLNRSPQQPTFRLSSYDFFSVYKEHSMTWNDFDKIIEENGHDQGFQRIFFGNDKLKGLDYYNYLDQGIDSLTVVNRLPKKLFQIPPIFFYENPLPEWLIERMQSQVLLEAI